ncbi:MAG: nucleotidyltransferase domain-containing protein [Kiritimatiellaeota bacterium]|nr:nucleotidyltransferase domain-containing protein [Kiritimatiellota bacterium]
MEDSEFLIPGISVVNNRKLFDLFKKEDKITEVILYGSRAKGNYREGSDIDLTVKGIDLTTNWLLRLMVEIDDLLMPYQVDISIFDYVENKELLDHIARVGREVYKK